MNTHPHPAPHRPSLAGAAGLVAAALLLAGCGGAATGNEEAVSDDGTVDLSKVTLIVGDQKGGSKALLQAAGELDDAAVQDPVAGLHLRAAAARGAQRRRDRHRRRRQHPAAVRGRRQEQVRGRRRPRRTAARATRSWSRRTRRIKSVADLKGKKVAVAEGSSANYNLLAQLDKAGLTYDDVEVQNLQPADALAAFTLGPPGRLGDLGPVHLAGRAGGRRPGARRRQRPGQRLRLPGRLPGGARRQGHDRRAQGLPRPDRQGPGLVATRTRRSGRRSGPRRPGSAPDVTLAAADERQVARRSPIGQRRSSTPSRRWPTRSPTNGLLPGEVRRRRLLHRRRSTSVHDVLSDETRR